MSMGVCPYMAGKSSRDLKQRVEHFRGNVDPNVVLKWFADLFSVSNYVKLKVLKTDGLLTKLCQQNFQQN